MIHTRYYATILSLLIELACSGVGQIHPSLGVGREVEKVMNLFCRRIGADGVVNVPLHWHNGEVPSLIY